MQIVPKTIEDIQIGDIVGIKDDYYSARKIEEMKVDFIDSEKQIVYVTEKSQSYVRAMRFTEVMYVKRKEIKESTLKKVFTWIQSQLK